MKRTLKVGRREFTRETLLAALSGVVVTVSGCGGGGDGGNPTSPSPSNVQGLVMANHGHSAVITDANITAGNAVQLDIRGGADHTHTVVLSADAVQAIRSRRAVAADSTLNSSPTEGTHQHTVTFNSDTGGPPSYY